MTSYNRKLPDWCFVRVVREPGTAAMPAVKIRNPADVAKLLRERMGVLDVEAF
jgi:hypothetical protein